MTESSGRAAVRERSQGICEVCGRNPASSWSHRQRRSAGGTWSPANGLHSCGHGTSGCEGFITANLDPLTGEPADLHALGLVVPSWDDPAEVPVRLLHPVYGPGWWLLSHTGLMRWVGSLTSGPHRAEEAHQ